MTHRFTHPVFGPLACALALVADADAARAEDAPAPGAPALAASIAADIAAPVPDAVVSQAPAPTPRDALRARLLPILEGRGLARSRVGLAVVDAGSGEILFAENADRPFNPASNTKILTTAAALASLGGDFRYRTSLHGQPPDERGVVRGPVELRGGGDPSLTNGDLADLARRLAATGVRRIEGPLLADGRFRDPAQPRATLGGGALVFHGNLYTIRVSPTQRNRPAAVSIDPAFPEYVVLDARVATVGKKATRLKVDVARRDGKLRFSVRGRINDKAAPERIKQRIGDGAPEAAIMFARALAGFGVEITGAIRSGGLPGDAPVLAEHHSGPLAEICKVSNKDSNNFVADTIFRTLGREVYGAPATMQKGARAVEDAMEKLGLPRGTYTIVNGSGLSHENRIRPDDLARLLRTLYFDLSVSPEFLSSLAIGGVDGTIKGRFRARDVVGHVKAKTGTLSSVSALSGYVGDRGERVLVFAILVDSFRDEDVEDVRWAQNRLVREMLGWLRDDRPGPALPPADPAPAPVAPAGDGDGDGENENEGG